VVLPERSSGQKVQIRAPGAMHHARWMAKALYSLKMYIFRKQLDISEQDMSGLRKKNIFITEIYAKYWFTAVKPKIASGKDLEFIKDLFGNTLVDKSLRMAAQEKFTKNHLWYLKDDLVGLAFLTSLFQLK